MEAWNDASRIIAELENAYEDLANRHDRFEYTGGYSIFENYYTATHQSLAQRLKLVRSVMTGSEDVAKMIRAEKDRIRDGRNRRYR